MKNTDTAANTITDEQIEALMQEAATHGDADMLSVCDLALSDAPQAPACRAECARVIADAQAQDDDVRNDDLAQASERRFRC